MHRTNVFPRIDMETDNPERMRLFLLDGDPIVLMRWEPETCSYILRVRGEKQRRFYTLHGAANESLRIVNFIQGRIAQEPYSKRKLCYLCAKPVDDSDLCENHSKALEL